MIGNNLSSFVPSTNPFLSIAQSNGPTVVTGVHQKHHTHHIGKLPTYPYPYENIDNKYKWKVSSHDSNHQQKGNGKLQSPLEETPIFGKSTIYSNHPSKTTSLTDDFYRQPTYEPPTPPITAYPTPFNYPTIATDDIQTKDIDSTTDNRLPPWMEMLQIKHNAYDMTRAPIDYYAKALENQPKHAFNNYQPQYGLTHIDKK